MSNSIFMEMLEELVHYGTPRHSGRYPWGSGENPYQHPYQFKTATEFYDYILRLKKEGLQDKEIAEYLSTPDEPMTVTRLKQYRSIAKSERTIEMSARALMLLDRCEGNVSEVGRIMGVNESQVRNWLKGQLARRASLTQQVADKLKSAVDEREVIDVGKGVETGLGVTRTRLDTAITQLEGLGYKHYNNIKVPQVGTNHETTFNVLARPDVEWKDVQLHPERIKTVDAYHERNSDEIKTFKPPVSISSKRLMIRYAEDGGVDRDGEIEIRPGLADLNLGANHYAQVRIAVDDKSYLKGMCVYGYDLPDGIDVRFNTNKPRGTPLHPGKKVVNGVEVKTDGVLKGLKDDADMPFGAVIKSQIEYDGPDGKKHLSPINIVSEEGSWDNWSRSTSSQLLSKQKPALVRRQLGLVLDGQRDEMADIMTISNPLVRKQALESFADDCESKAIHLRGAAMPRQTTKVAISIPSLKRNEVYCPEYPDGEVLALIRYPHAGFFESPSVTVNNRNREARKVIGADSKDAIGVHPDIAKQLSGADFDGDNFLCIPNRDGDIKTSKPYKELLDFEPSMFKKNAAQVPTGYKTDGFNKGREMGNVSNLITDMQIQGAPIDEIFRAVKHSMVVIDAEKHNYDWKASEKIFGIPELKRRYQLRLNPTTGKENMGASTIVSMRKQEVEVDERKAYPSNSPEAKQRAKETGEYIYQPTGRTYLKYGKMLPKGTVLTPEQRSETVMVDGEEIPRYRVKKNGVIKEYTGGSSKAVAKTKIPLFLATDDVHTLGRGFEVEQIYADFIEDLKSQAKEARRIAANTETARKSNATAREQYAEERASLLSKLEEAYKRKPMQRQAQILASVQYRAKLNEHPEWEYDKEMLNKVRKHCMEEARLRVGVDRVSGAGKKSFEITPREAEAVQAGALSTNELSEMIKVGNLDDFKSIFMPRNEKSISTAKQTRIKNLLSAGATIDEVAKLVGVSASTVKEYS